MGTEEVGVVSQLKEHNKHMTPGTVSWHDAILSITPPRVGPVQAREGFCTELCGDFWLDDAKLFGLHNDIKSIRTNHVKQSSSKNL